MRGKVSGTALLGGIFGITPAYAGKSHSRTDNYRKNNRITPAYAGKSQIRSDLFGDDEGSPPPMRGKEDKTAEAK